MKTIYPVVLKVPLQAQNLKGREKVAFLSQHARKAVDISARHGEMYLWSLLKDSRGVPLPFQGHFWSVSHKTSYVGGVVAPKATGIDIEKIKSVKDGLFDKTARDSEWNLSPNPRSWALFFQFWTAKEAVLKATGVGISGLLQCTVTGIVDNNHMILKHQGRSWYIEHYFFDGHVAAVVKDDFCIKWVF